MTRFLLCFAGRLTAVLVLLASGAGGLVSPLRAAAGQPNIVVFLSDDHTAADSSVYGSKDVATPSMDRLARDGVVFDRAFVASPSCAPSRAVLLTGLMPARNGAEANHARPEAGIKKFPAYFHDLGYEVVAIGKVGHYRQTAEYGFDYTAHMGYHDDEAVPSALTWLRERKSPKPLVLIVGTNWPHVPWPGADPGRAESDVMVPSTQVDTERTRQARLRYYAAIGRMDTELGQVYDAARQTLGADTLFVHTSDHGSQFPFGKWNCYEAGIRSPMIIVWPGVVKPGTRTSAMVSWVDLLPTLLDATGGQVPRDLDGRSFLPVLRGETDAFRERIFATHSGDGNMNVYPIRAIRGSRWKLILNLHPEFQFNSHINKGQAKEEFYYWGSWVEKAALDPAAAAVVKRYHQRPAVELYDLEADPTEGHNLAADPDQTLRVKSLRAELEAWMRVEGDEGRVYGDPTLLPSR